MDGSPSYPVEPPMEAAPAGENGGAMDSEARVRVTVPSSQFMFPPMPKSL